ncbi:MAG: PEP-CTERM sorting domain-containing protein [Bryobacterales bacterium]|nr:PEP-CTERM sorting domain-containing protein [Bryobacterales bacterium]
MEKKNVLHIMALAAALLIGGSTVARADTIEAKVVELIAYGKVEMSIDSGANWAEEYAGNVLMQRTGGTSPIELLPDPVNFVTFCIEPRENISLGSTYTWEVEPLSRGTTSIGGMGVAKAELVRELIGRQYPVWGGTPTAVQAAAIQVAIWEIVEETSGTLDVLNGSVRYRNESVAGTLDLAQAMLDELDGTGPMPRYLYALTNPTQQDIFGMAIPHGVPDMETPEPATFAMFGGGLFLLGILRKRQQAK